MAVKKQRALQPCTALLKDGSRCGKYAKAGEPFCAVHSPGYVPKGAAVPRPKPVSHEERLRRFAESSDPRIAMQAIGILERRRSDAETSGPTARMFLDALTPAEREAIRSLVAQLRAIQQVVYDRRPDLRPAGMPPLGCVVTPEAAPPVEDPPTTPPASAVEETPTSEDEDDYLVIE